MRRLALVLAFTIVGVSALALTPPMPRQPALSPDGALVAFSWQGDIWIAPSNGGAARRITANPAYDQHPVWFPDGKKLAFASDRDGSDDVWVVDLANGKPSRLTYHEAADLPQGVLGNDVVFTSRRHEAWDREPAVYRIPSTGGTEALALKSLALEVAPSPDGRYLALVRGGTPADRRHYRGAASRKIWLYEVATGKLERVTKHEWDDDSVAWAGNGALLYRSDNGGEDRNVFRMDLATRKVVQLTHHKGADVRSVSGSVDGKLVAYELWDAIYTVPADGSGSPKRLDLDVPADSLEPGVERDTAKADAEDVVPSPDGSQAALVIRGDVWVVQARAKDQTSVAEPPTVRVTATAARERDVVWSPDGKQLVYASDRNGELDLYSAKPADREDGKFYRAGKFAEKRLTAGPLDAHSPRFSPDGKQLAYVRGKGDLVVAGADGTNPKVLFEHWGSIDFSWSPDSKWIAFAREDQWHNNEIWIIPSAGGTAVNVSQHPQDDLSPVWSPDGRRLYWLSKRHANGVDIWCAYLTKADHERSKEEWLELFEDEKAKKDEPKGDAEKSNAKEADREKATDTAKAKPKEEKKPPKPVVIDFDGIHDRARALTQLAGDEGELAVSPDSQTIVFAAQPEGETDLYKIRWDGKELSRLTNGGVEPSQIVFAKDGKTLFYRSGKGTVGHVGLDGKAADPVPFAARCEVNREALRAQVFDEAWRELDRHFADPTFHGRDWKALHDRYRPLAMSASSRRDFDDVMNMMLGELNASHMGFRGPSRGSRAQTGELGIEVAPTSDGKGVLISEILPDTPASRVDVALKAGERIVAVNDQEIGATTNFFALLTETSGQRLRLKVAGDKGEREVTVTPVKVADGREARYQKWTRERRALVERLSGGKLGYIHIQGMSLPSLEDFERDLYAAANGKQGLLIDVRNNGGGWTTDYLMAILNVKRHAFTVPRDGDSNLRAYPQDRLPLPAWTRPAATLCDEASYSNAEIFSWAFKTLKRGSLVGMPTFGAVMSTGGARLVDGSTVRLPERAWFVAGSGIDMENHGCPPDFVVEKPPQQDMSATDDAQLAKAVEVLLSQLPKDPAQLPW